MGGTGTESGPMLASIPLVSSQPEFKRDNTRISSGEDITGVNR